MSTSAKLAVMTDVLNILDKPERWTQNSYARNAEGKGVLATHESAVCFCMYGAIFRSILGITQRVAQSTECQLSNEQRALVQEIGGDFFEMTETPVSIFNDHPQTTYEKVITKVSELRDHYLVETVDGATP